jgi:hypothetical protein
MSSFDTANAAAARLEQAWVNAGFADADAVGIALDNPDDPHVAVAVHDGRIVYIGISDPMLRGGLKDLENVLNGCIYSAFSMWFAQRSGIAQ